MKILLIGAPGAGKGTQAELICKNHHIPHIATGDMLRQAIKNKTPLGEKARIAMEAGELVADDIVISLVKERIQQSDATQGFLLDGFPRTINQAMALQENDIKLDHVIEIAVPDELVIKRVSGRRVHIPSGRVYNTDLNPPKEPGKDDITGEPLIQREDDKEETVRRRLENYHRETAPLIVYYKDTAQREGTPKFAKIDGTKSVSYTHLTLPTTPYV